MVFIVKNCYRLNLSCPEGMKPEYDHVICERNYENHFTGTWKIPNRKHSHSFNSCEEIKPIVKACKDLDEKYYDATVNVSFLYRLSDY